MHPKARNTMLDDDASWFNEAINRIICGTKLCLTDILWLQAFHYNADILLQTIVCFIDIFLIDTMYVLVLYALILEKGL